MFYVHAIQEKIEVGEGLKHGNATEATSRGSELMEALRREANLKSRVDELVATLEKLTRNSEARHQQSADFVDDLKRANAALVAAFEKAKKKHVSKIKKMESQIVMMREKHENTVGVLRQRIAVLKQEEREEEEEEEEESDEVLM